MGIRRLPSAVVSSLRTDVTVTTTAQCVTELVLNSIDARASSIAVRVDLKNYKIQVVDNGCGLSSTDLSLVGSRYMTSKCHSLQDLQSNLSHFGFRGEALSSISEVCGTMTIASRCQGSDETFCKVFTRGTAHNVCKSRQPRASCGTTITVADFLYNRPVRRARIKPALDLEELKSHIESIALINPTVSFSIRNDENGEVMLQTQRTEDTQSAFGTLFGESIAVNLVAVKECMGPFKVEGYISNEAHPLKNLQFIYINRRLLLKTKIHKLVNSLLSRSAILKSNNVPYAPISKELNHNLFLAFSPPKRDKHAVFVLNITCPLSEYDITLDPKKTLVEFCNWDSLLSCFENLLRKFIEREANQSSVKSNGFDSEPPRKIKSVMDEINLLAREVAVGGDVSQTSDESISTKNLPRAIHSLPANRCPVNLSPVPSTEWFPSTCSSDIFSRATDVKGTTYSTSGPVSVLTEKPYVPLARSQAKDKLKEPSGWTETDCSERSRYSVESLNFLFKRPELPGVTKPTKRFISEPIYFQENSRIIDNPLKLQEKNSKFGDAAASPLNALANIKEIRRKKLLSNLNKFSFNVTCEKPVLLKTKLPTHHARDTDKNLQKLNQAFCEKLPVNNLKESRAVQTTFTPSSLDSTENSEKNTSLMATAASSAVASSCRSEDQNSLISANFCAPVITLCSNKQASDVIKCDKNVLKPSGSEENINAKMNCYQALRCSKSPDISKKQDELESAHPNILSVEDMIETVYSEQQNMGLTSIHDETLHSTCVKGGQEHVGIFTESRNESLISQVSEVSKLRCGDMSFGIREAAPGKNSVSSELSLPDDSIGHSSTKICDAIPYNSDIFQSTDTDTKPQTLSKKIVDYDSSPCSSQESLRSVENLVQSDIISPSVLKRKSEKGDELLVKKFCSCSENHFTEKPSVSQDINVDEEMLKLDDYNFIHKDSCEQETLKDTSLIPDTSLKNFEADEGSILLSSTEPNHNEEMDEVLKCQKSIPNQHPCEDNCTKIKNCQAKIMEVKAQDSSLTASSNDQQQWIEQLDHNGKSFYLHQKSGLTTYQKPKEERQGAFKIGDRYSFLPKGMSPILYDKVTNEPNKSPSITPFRMEEDLSVVKWSSDGGINADKKPDFWPLVDQLLSAADSFSTKIHAESQVSNATNQELSQTDIKVYNVMFPYSFSKDLFNNLRVLGQLDNKFIVTIVTTDTNKDVIVLFDQHAVHERIRVENLTEDYKQHDGEAKWKSAPVDPALPMQLSSIEVRILESYQEKMENLGFHFSVVDSTTISVLRVPTCLLLRENREVNGRGVSVLRQHLESLIREQVDSLLNTRGVGTDHPTIIRNVISSEACRGAVKFGHPLTVADCQAFLHNLSLCNLPFQCAHGRPALMPVVDLSMLKQKPQIQKPNLNKLLKRLL